VEAARPALADDLDAVAALARLAVAELSLLRGGALWARRDGRLEPVEPLLAAQLERPDDEGAAVVGTVDGVIVGYGVSELESLPDGGLLAVVTDLYVAPEARGVGIGEAMMDLLVAHARRHGAIGVDAMALPGDRATKNFFETFGLKARAIVVHRSLVDDGPGREDAGDG
jgi:ribosomal protein S18 acetylase RimI-like enzyme